MKNNDWLQSKVDLCSGATAGLLTDFLLHPLDTIVARLWIQGSSGTRYRYAGLIHGIRELFNREGFQGLYKGFFSVALFSPAGYGLYFAAYHWSKDILSSYFPQSDSRIHAISGIFANAVGGLAWTPMDVVKLHQQASVHAGYSTPIHGLVQLYLKEGATKSKKGCNILDIAEPRKLISTDNELNSCIPVQVFDMEFTAATGPDLQPTALFQPFILSYTNNGKFCVYVPQVPAQKNRYRCLFTWPEVC